MVAVGGEHGGSCWMIWCDYVGDYNKEVSLVSERSISIE